METIKYKTSSPAGDLLTYLAGVKRLWERTGKKGVIYQLLDVLGVGLPGDTRPFLNENGDSVCMNKAMFERLYPLIKSQPYIEDFLEYKGEKVDFDFDEIRMKVHTGQPAGSIYRWFNYTIPEMASDLSKAWVKVGTTKGNVDFFSDKVIINFTNRYRNNYITYFFLKEYEKKIWFAGTEKELKQFNKRWGLNIPHLNDKDFEDFRAMLCACKFFLGNQSVCYHIAEACKVKRILEISPQIPHVIPNGADAYDFYYQEALELYFKELINA